MILYIKIETKFTIDVVFFPVLGCCCLPNLGFFIYIFSPPASFVCFFLKKKEAKVYNTEQKGKLSSLPLLVRFLSCLPFILIKNGFSPPVAPTDELDFSFVSLLKTSMFCFRLWS